MSPIYIYNIFTHTSWNYYIYIYTSTMFHHFHFRKFCRFAEVERASSSCLPHCFDWRFSQGSSQLQPRSTSRCPGPCFLICIECRYVGICRLLFFPARTFRRFVEQHVDQLLVLFPLPSWITEAIEIIGPSWAIYTIAICEITGWYLLHISPWYAQYGWFDTTITPLEWSHKSPIIQLFTSTGEFLKMGSPKFQY